MPRKQRTDNLSKTLCDEIQDHSVPRFAMALKSGPNT